MEYSPNQKSRKRIHLIANSKSGKGHGENIASLAAEICRELGVEFIDYEISGPHELENKTDEAIQAARKNADDVIVAAGGDGTIRSVAEKVHRAGRLNFAVVPCGTFNFFARAHGVPEDHAEALRLAIRGQAQSVRLGEISGKIFLINASLGIYAKSIAERESSTKKFGRNRLVVIFSTMLTLLRPHRLLHVDMKVDGVTKEIRTPMIFIGNNALQLRDLSLSVASCFKRQLLAVVTLKPVRGWEMFRVIARGALKTLEQEERLNQFCIEELIIWTKRKKQTVALDGEIFKMTSPFKIRSLPDGLNMIVGKPEEQT